jgi:hypothetical protein
VQSLLGCCSSIPSLVLVSGADEYVPQLVNVGDLSERVKEAMSPNSRAVVLDGVHNLAGLEKDLTFHVLQFLSEIICHQ